jgi:outer membrane protein OmpA-like peptidoglycan-associated protein
MMTRILLSILLVAGAACGKSVAFQGQSTIPVVGTPPAKEVATPTPPRVEMRDNKIELHEKIQFDWDKATIKEASFGLMNEIADVINKNPQVVRIRIEGHASADGEARHNKVLSDERAKSVMKYLVGHGIPAGRLTAVGYGIERPIADNSTPSGREANRRVEFMIVEQDVTHKKIEIDPKTGAEKIVEEKHETVKAPDSEAQARGKPAP